MAKRHTREGEPEPPDVTRDPVSGEIDPPVTRDPVTGEVIPEAAPKSRRDEDEDEPSRRR